MKEPWLGSDTPEAALRYARLHLQGADVESLDRRERLLACGCCRRLFHPFQEKAYLEAVAIAEDHADGKTSANALKLAQEEWQSWSYTWIPGFGRCVVQAVRGALQGDPTTGAIQALQATMEAGVELEPLFRCIFSKPFLSVTIEPQWLTPKVIDMATAFYRTSRADAMPVLGDALEDAGCSHERILDHCRQGSFHSRGCWVVDLILETI